MGKSALTWKWLLQNASESMRPLAGRLWWSFYEAEADFDRFVTAALAYCTGRSLQAVRAISRFDRENELLAVLNEKPFLIVLDGVERLLIAYAGLDCARLPEEDLDTRTENVVAGVPVSQRTESAETTPIVGQHRLRKTIDPNVGNFFRKICRIQASRVLMTTRLYPSELQTVTGRELPGAAAVFLRGLQPDDALTLWHGMGVSGSDDELLALFGTFEYYPLLIRALAGEVARFRPAPGDFGEWQSAHPGFNPFAIPLIQVKSHVLAHSLGNLDRDATDVLRIIAAFRTPVNYATLSALDARTKGSGEPHAERLDNILTELEDRGLVGWDRVHNHYDLHPIVRGVVWNTLDKATQQGVYVALRSHFEAFPSLSAAKTLTAAKPAMDLFDALVGLSHYQEAVRLYFGRIHGVDFASEGALPLQIGMLESLFPDGWDSLSGYGAADVLTQLAHAYSSAGRLEEAGACYSKSLELREKRGSIRLGYNYLSQVERLQGKLRNALVHAHRSFERTNDPFKFSVTNLSLCKAITGLADEGFEELTRVDRSSVYAAQIALWMGDHERAVEQASSAIHGIVPLWIGERLLCNVVLAESLLSFGHSAQAEPLLNETLKEAIAKSIPRFELEARRVWAELRRRRGEPERAREMLNDLWELAGRGGFRLLLADAQLVLAAIESDTGNAVGAREAAAAAYRAAWCDGPPHTYYWALQKATDLLNELGADIPVIQ
jgi:tetratricopeptide (TPR) repeat protein